MRLALLVLSLAGSAAAQAPSAYDPARTQVVLLGTGTPNPDPARSGPALAIVVHGAAYLVDAGPGVVRRAAAAERAGVAALAQPNLKVVFITHLHSDHTLGLPDLIFSPWVLERAVPLEVYGPSGIAAMTGHLERAYAEDVRIRTTGGQPHTDSGYVVHAHEIDAGVVYRDSNVTVTAFRVDHGGVPAGGALGYKFVTRDRTIVISGDTRPTEEIVKQCAGCDVLVHEVYSRAGWATRPPGWRRYHESAHTSGEELGALAARARPKLLVLTHGLPWSETPEEIVREVRRAFAGPVAYANDLEVY
jgi:ribonuclease BN (tRNA processing enzyme)